jgi:hypothetical protein
MGKIFPVFISSSHLKNHIDMIATGMTHTKEHQLKMIRQRKQRKESLNHYTKKYEKTKNGFLMRLYHNMKSRIGGIQWKKRHLYAGKELLAKELFYEWSKNSGKFHELFEQYKESGFKRTLAPSVDRIDSTKGYELSNMEWVTMLENSIRGNVSRNKQRIAKNGNKNDRSSV